MSEIKFGHEFKFIHSTTPDREVFLAVRASEDLPFTDLLQAFRTYALACGYTEETVSKFLECEFS